MKKRLALLACLFLALQLGACTSKDSRDEEAAAEESVSSADGSLEDVEGFESAESTEGVEGEGAIADAGDGESFTEEAHPDTPPGDMTADTGGDLDVAGVDEGGTASADEAALPPSEPGFTDSAPTSDSAFTDSTTSHPPEEMAMSEPPPPPPADIAPPVSSGGSSDARSFPVHALKKMEATPIEREGVILNTVYFARPGDSFSKIAKKIYNDSKKTKDLRNWNPDTMPRVGDPIYYNSPNRPGDAAVMKVYYEDIGQQPQMHVAAEGEDLKKVSKEALGFDGAWKEVWATNSQESKGKLAAGTELRFYGASGEVAPAAPAPTMAENTPPPAPEMPMEPDLGVPAPPMDSPDMAGLPPPPDAGMMPPDHGLPPQEPDMGLPPVDAGTGDAMAGMNAPPPDMAPPPPPPPPEETSMPMAKRSDQLGGESADNDIMMALIAGGGMAALLAGFMVARRRRQQREMAAAFGDTQVGT